LIGAVERRPVNNLLFAPEARARVRLSSEPDRANLQARQVLHVSQAGGGSLTLQGAAVMQLNIGTPERRQILRGMTDREPKRSRLVATIMGSYREMPGLCLRLDQAARLFNLSAQTCRSVLEDLVRQRRLRVDMQGQYRLQGA
jgi:hypothetical protein